LIDVGMVVPVERLKRVLFRAIAQRIR
jgi:hypothetical protein